MKRILIVDDAVFARRALRKLVEKYGYEVVGEAEDGASAIVQYKALRPDWVMLDIVMPGMNGIETLRELKRVDENTKVIMVSAMGSENHVREAIQNGASYFMVKPLDEEDVREILEKTVG